MPNTPKAEISACHIEFNSTWPVYRLGSLGLIGSFYRNLEVKGLSRLVCGLPVLRKFTMQRLYFMVIVSSVLSYN